MSSTGDGERLYGEVALRLQELPPGPVGIAFSGGPDSLSLAILLSSVAGSRPVFLFHVEHNLRGEEARAGECRRVEELAEALGLRLCRGELAPGEVEERAREADIGIEAAARELRYRTLGELAEEMAIVALATGHHQEDQLETILLQLLRGAPEQSLGGMPARRPFTLPSGRRIPLLRPLLGIPREEVHKLLSRVGLLPIEDPSNGELRYERNYLRKEVLPALLGAERNSRKGLLRSAEGISRMADMVRLSAKRLGFRRTHEGLLIESRRFFGAPRPVRAAAIEAEAAKRGLELPNRSIRFVEPLLGEEPPSRWVDPATSELLLSAGNHLFTLHRGWLIWQYDIVPDLDFGYLHVVDIPDLDLRWMRGVWPSIVKAGTRRRCVVSLAGESVRPPVVVRSRKPGDRLYSSGELRPLKSLYDRYSIPQVVRENIPIIEDRNGILVVPSDLFGFPRIRRDGLLESDTGTPGAVEVRFFMHGDFV